MKKIQKPATTFAVAPEVRVGLSEFVKSVGFNDKQSWIAVNAAFLMLMDSDVDARDFYLSAVASAGAGIPSFGELVSRALRREMRVRENIAPPLPNSEKPPAPTGDINIVVPGTAGRIMDEDRRKRSKAK